MVTSTSAESGFQISLLRCAAGTDVGMRREENQDSFGVVRGTDFSAFFVADGMGGAHGGAIASRMAIAALEAELAKPGYKIAPERIIELVKSINKQIFDRGSNDPRYAGMGTTLVGLIFTPSAVLEVNVGDSRAYRIRDGVIEQISEDHTLVRELVRSGALEEKDAEHHPVSHMLTRSLGPVAEVEVECRFLAEKPIDGDCYVLCSDGLYNLVPEADIMAVVNQNPLDDANQILINLANQRGGSDNITAVVISVGGEAVRDRTVSTGGAAGTVEDKAVLESDEAVHEAERRVGAVPPIVQEPAETKRVRKESRGRATDGRTLSTSTPMLFMLGLTLGIGLVLGSVTRHLFWSKQPERASEADERLQAGDPPAAPEAGVDVGENDEGPLLELARQIRRVDKTSDEASNSGSLERPRKREELTQSIATLRSQISLLDNPPSAGAADNAAAAKVRYDALSREYQALNTSLDAASRAVTLWVRRQVRLEDPDVFAYPGELEKVGAYSEAVKQKMALLSSLSYQYGEKADASELHPNDESRRIELESLARKRDELKRELKDEVRKAVAGLFGKSYREYEGLKTKQDILWRELQTAKRDLEVLTGIAEDDPLKRRALQATLRIRLEDEIKRLHTLEKTNIGDR